MAPLYLYAMPIPLNINITLTPPHASESQYALYAHYPLCTQRKDKNLQKMHKVYKYNEINKLPLLLMLETP